MTSLQSEVAELSKTSKILELWRIMRLEFATKMKHYEECQPVNCMIALRTKTCVHQRLSWAFTLGYASASNALGGGRQEGRAMSIRGGVVVALLREEGLAPTIIVETSDAALVWRTLAEERNCRENAVSVIGKRWAHELNVMLQIGFSIHKFHALEEV
jgi:hypothetical protein